jgi:mannose/fructose/N-acetylgalactosamine-specific phosphotransferase system component IIB
MGVPPEMDVYFHTVEEAAEKLPSYQRDERRGALLTGDIETMARLIELTRSIPRVNLGGIHHRVGRTQRLRYVFLAPDEEKALRELAARGVDVSAQDVPAARPLGLNEVLSGEGNR